MKKKLSFMLAMIMALAFVLPLPTLKAQTITVPFEISQGFKFKDYHNPQWYLVQTSIKPGVSYLDDKVKSTVIVSTFFTDGETDIFAGTGLGFKCYQTKDTANTFSIEVGATALLGSNSRKLYGLYTNFEFYKRFSINLNARQEYRNKELWFDAGFQVTLLPL